MAMYFIVSKDNRERGIERIQNEMGGEQTNKLSKHFGLFNISRCYCQVSP